MEPGVFEPLAAEAARLMRGRVEPVSRELLLEPSMFEGSERLLLGLAVLAARGVVEAVFTAPGAGAARLLGRALARLDLAYASEAVGEKEYRCLSHVLLSFLGRGAGDREALLLAAERTREAVRLGVGLACTGIRLGADPCGPASLLRRLSSLPAVRAGGLVDQGAGDCLRFLEDAVEAMLAACSGGGSPEGFCRARPCER